MGTPQFRMSFGTTPATAEDLSRVEEIEVTQEMDRFWEARIRMVMCLDAQGRWQHRTDGVAAFSRVRVELDPGDGRFVPLIDGPVTQFESTMDSQPGRSTATFVVRDDSVLLHRDEETVVFRERSDSDVARELLTSVPTITETDIEDTTATQPVTTQRSTRLTLLTQLAAANGYRAYVLPGSTAGRSIGCFRRDPQRPDAALPALRLVGSQRNMAQATVEENPERPERTRGRTLRLSDGELASFETSATAQGLDGDRPAVPDDLSPVRLLPPSEATRDDPEAATAARARDAAYAFKLSGSVVPGCYAAVLSPYRKLRVELGETGYSGVWLLTKVVHRITPSLWTQQLEALGNAATEVSSSPVAEAPGGGLSVSFSASVGVF